jgi:cytidylate kinase
VSPREAEAFDERVDPWLHRITRSIWGLGADGVSTVAPLDMFDAQKAAYLTRQVIEEVYRQGQCVIVGRGSQCILRDRPDVFHACVYARWEERVRKIKQRVKQGADAEALIRSMDAERMEYLRLHFKQNRMDPYLYDIMIDSKNQNEKVARIIISVMKMVPPAEFSS